ncbi:cytosolic phospholipase A2-like [Clavelina lepadiformis]|uniref:cytosolic phospholipase A2-like n=1 Tax=Clavelina lepadiformis TaxID=159417 RepID=UPI0040435F5C
MEFEEFEKFENDHQNVFDDFKLGFNPTIVVTVTLLRCRDVSVSYFYDMFDTPDPQFRVRCPSIPKSKTFVTVGLKDDTPTSEINETFKFVIPDEMKDVESLPVVISMYDVDVMSDDRIGTKRVDVVKEVKLGESINKTIDYNGHGELDVEISRELRTTPDFRLSLGLHPEERAFRKKRLPIVYETLRNILGPEKGPSSLKETPVVSMVTSGGGYRAVVGMCGAMEALNDAGLMNIFTYAAGLSGSAWYLQSVYALQGILSSEQAKFHDELKKRLAGNLFLDLVNPFTISSYQSYIAETKEKNKQPHSFVDYFPGYLVGKHTLGEKNMHLALSDLKTYVSDGKVPYPIIASLHAKSSVSVSKFHAYYEETPFEVSLPEYGIGLSPDTVGSTWTGGFLVDKLPELPLHFSQGMTGCAFSILLQDYLKNGNERASDLGDYIDDERVRGKQFGERVIEIESDDEEDTDEENDDLDMVPTVESNLSNPESIHSPKPVFLKSLVSQLSFFTDRNAFVGRTARLNNFAQGFSTLKRYLMNPFDHGDAHNAHEQELLDALGVLKMKRQMSTRKNVISVIDAGLLFNVPTSVALRPQRMCDLLIVMDLSGYESDEKFSYSSILHGAAHAWRSGLHYPPVNFEKITNLPPKEFLIFPSDDDDCPTILWFTLCNKTFKNLKDYTPRSKERPKDDKKFNDFPVFVDGSPYSTFNFQYSGLEFDRLRELMYYNVTSHIDEIKVALEDAVARKTRRSNKFQSHSK